jgi:ATP-dependent Lhr-like helicase
VRAHRSTLIFVNSRRIAERLAQALNELAARCWPIAHHGSVAPAQRAEIEDRLKAGDVKALVATSSLELGIDMGAIDPGGFRSRPPPSVASGLQRIGPGGHQVGAPAAVSVFPKYRGDLLACCGGGAGDDATARSSRCATRATRSTCWRSRWWPWWRWIPMTTTESPVRRPCRRAAPFASAGARRSFDGLLDMLAGNRSRTTSPSCAAPELGPAPRAAERARGRPADRGHLRAAPSPTAVCSGVFLAGSGGAGGRARGAGGRARTRRWCSRAGWGETFLLGASTWRIEEITHDRVLVSPAPASPGKMPFWRGESAAAP